MLSVRSNIPIKLIGKVGKEKNAETIARLEPSLKMAQVLAEYIRARVLREAMIPSSVEGGKVRHAFSTRRKVTVNRRYMAKVGLSNNQKTWKSSKEFMDAAGSKAGDASTSGGLWKGLRVRNYGAKGATIEFYGKSIGRAVRWRKSWKEIHRLKREELAAAYARKKTKSGKLSKAARKQIARATSRDFARRYEDTRLTPNRIKGASYRVSTKLNPLMPTESEVLALGESVGLFTINVLGEILPLTDIAKAQRSKDRLLIRTLTNELAKTKRRDAAAASRLLS